MKRYYIDGNPNDWIEEESNDGEYVKYEDVQALIQWMKDSAKKWEGAADYVSSVCGFISDDAETLYDCAEELEQKLREIGEL